MPTINAELVKKVLKEMEDILDAGDTERGWMDALASKHGIKRQLIIGWTRKFKHSSKVPAMLDASDAKVKRGPKPMQSALSSWHRPSEAADHTPPKRESLDDYPDSKPIKRRGRRVSNDEIESPSSIADADGLELAKLKDQNIELRLAIADLYLKLRTAESAGQEA